jgi:DNA-binding CsgD family transcriptional regulator
MVEKEGLNSIPKISKLTNAQKDILHLISDEFLTIKQIAQRRKCTIQAVYKIIAQIKKKGYLDIGLNKVEKVETTFNQTDLRLHGQEINIKIIYQNNKYQELLNKSNTLFIDSNTIRLYKNSIEIYSGQSFFGKDINEVETRSLEYLQRFLIRLEHELKVGLIKNRARNIRIVNQHYARGNSEISDNATKNRERVWVYAEEDGKLAFITDDSFGFNEDETVHPITAKPDRIAVDKQVNDWRLNNPPTNSQLAQFQAENTQGLKKTLEAVDNLLEQQKDLPKVINDLKKQIKSHLALIKEYRKENINQRNKINKRLDEIEQTRLRKWF